MLKANYIWNSRLFKESWNIEHHHRRRWALPSPHAAVYRAEVLTYSVVCSTVSLGEGHTVGVGQHISYDTILATLLLETSTKI